MLQCVFRIEGGTSQGLIPRNGIAGSKGTFMCSFVISTFPSVQIQCLCALLQWYWSRACVSHRVSLKECRFVVLKVSPQVKFTGVRFVARKRNEYVVLPDITKLPSKWLYQFAFPPAMGDRTCFPTALPTGYAVICFLMFSSAMV